MALCFCLHGLRLSSSTVRGSGRGVPLPTHKDADGGENQGAKGVIFQILSLTLLVATATCGSSPNSGREGGKIMDVRKRKA